MKEIKSIDRSFQNQRNEVIEADVPKSAFNMSYRNHLGGLVLGRLYPQSIQHLMPNDKISGSNEGNIIFERLATPVVDTIDVCQHNFMVTLRSIDKQWEKFQTPSKLNNMNNGVTVPCFDLEKIINCVLLDFVDNIIVVSASSTTNNPKVTISARPLVRSYFNSWKDVYHDDAALDFIEQIYTILGSGSQTVLDFNTPTDVVKFRQIMHVIFDFFIGKRSLLDYLGYICIDSFQIDKFLDDLFKGNWKFYFDYSLNYPLSSWFYDTDIQLNIGEQPENYVNNFIVHTGSGTMDTTTYLLQNEYALRAYYAIWFEYYRNYDLEPRSANLPEYHDFGSTSIFGSYPSFDKLHYLIPRIRSWQKDAFTTAGIDDISRHVFAPILQYDMSVSVANNDDLQPDKILDNKVTKQSISWRNPNTGTVSTITVPVPSRVLDQLNSSSSQNGIGLELFSLRKAHMLENYLKRIYYGGDEYRDRMLHLYGARIEDYRINRPEWLSSSLDTVDPKQEVANTGISPTNDNPDNMPIGSRVATATAVASGTDGFTAFSPEFGIFISILSLMPHATYNPLLYQNIQRIGTDFPIPQFANQMEDVISTLEISRSSHRLQKGFGYAPYGHAYRARVDEVHGDYLDTKYDYCFLRYFGNDATNIPNLSYGFIHCRPDLPMFVNSVLLDGQAYGTFKHNFLVERPLPSPVETI